MHTVDCGIVGKDKSTAASVLSKPTKFSARVRKGIFFSSKLPDYDLQMKLMLTKKSLGALMNSVTGVILHYIAKFKLMM